MNTPVIRPRLCSAFTLVVSECISADLAPCSLPFSARSWTTVQQYFKLKPAPRGADLVMRCLLPCLGLFWAWSFDSLSLNVNMFLYGNVFSPSLSTWFQPNPQNSEILPCFFLRNCIFPIIYEILAAWISFLDQLLVWFELCFCFFLNIFKWVFTLCVCVNMYGVVNTLAKASELPHNTWINLAVTVLRAGPVLSVGSFW